jgi:endo-1,4-beta-xylanase
MVDSDLRSMPKHFLSKTYLLTWLILINLTCFAAGPEIPSLAEIYQGKFLFGFNGTNSPLIREPLLHKDPTITGIINRQSNIIGINCFYPFIVHPKAETWNWEQCDQMLTFAETHPSWPRRAHVLFWPFFQRGNLEWMIRDKSGSPVSREEATRRLHDYIRTVMGHYKGRFKYWDVLNEVVDPNEPDGLRKGLWKDVLGKDFVELAFRFAREADPDAKLFYNDYDEWMPAKREIIYKLVKDLKQKGLIDGLGLQQHVYMDVPKISDLDQTIARYAEIGVELQVTELDVENNQDGKQSEFTPEMAKAQATRYRDLFNVYLKYAGKISAVLTWNVTDKTIWRRENPTPHKTWPLLFDDDGKPKPAFWSLVTKTQ